MEAYGLHLLLDKRIGGEIDCDGVRNPLEPAIEGVQVTPVRSRRWHTAGGGELLLEDVAAHLFEMLSASCSSLRSRIPEEDRPSALAGDPQDADRCSSDPADAADAEMACPTARQSLFS